MAASSCVAFLPETSLRASKLRDLRPSVALSAINSLPPRTTNAVSPKRRRPRCVPGPLRRPLTRGASICATRIEAANSGGFEPKEIVSWD